MRGYRWRIVAAVALLIATLAFLAYWRRSRPVTAEALPAGAEARDLPAAPDVAVSIEPTGDREFSQGTPLIITVRASNPRAANAAALNRAHDDYAAALEKSVGNHELTPEAARAGLALAHSKYPVRAVTLSAAGRRWVDYVRFELRLPGGEAKPLDWNLALPDPPAAGTLVLDAASRSEARYTLAPAAAAAVPPGEYTIVAVLEIPAGAPLPPEAWRGRVESHPVTVKIAPASARPAAGERAGTALDRAEFFAGTHDWGNALGAAQAALALDPDSLRGHIVAGQAREAQSDLAGARDDFATALRLFHEQNPNSYEPPQYLIRKVITLDGRLGAPPR